MPINALRAVAPDSEGPDHPILTDAPQYPQWAIVREIDFRIDPTAAGDELVFFYSQFKRLLPVATPADFQTLLKEVCKPGYMFDGGPSNPQPPFSTLLSLNNHRKLAYIILKLAPGRLQFARKDRPIKMGDPGTASEAYYDAHRVDPLGQADPGNPGVIKDGCQVAYFISDGPKAEAHGSYPHGFNLYVDLFVTGSEPMPLKIDPDVRHPGGSLE